VEKPDLNRRNNEARGAHVKMRKTRLEISVDMRIFFTAWRFGPVQSSDVHGPLRTRSPYGKPLWTYRAVYNAL